MGNGRVALVFDLEATDSDRLGPGRIDVIPIESAPSKTDAQKVETYQSTTSLTLASVSAGAFDVKAWPHASTTRAYHLDVTLAG